MRYRLYIPILFFFLSLSAVAQKKIMLSGKVIDANNQGIELASVRIKGTILGTMTGLEGKYELSVPASDSLVVIFSCLGYRTEEKVLLTSEGNVTLNARLYKSDKSLQEVVIAEHRKQTRTLQRIDSKD